MQFLAVFLRQKFFALFVLIVCCVVLVLLNINSSPKKNTKLSLRHFADLESLSEMNHQHQISLRHFEDSESLAEIYHHFQKAERNFLPTTNFSRYVGMPGGNGETGEIAEDFRKINNLFPCVRGIVPIGTDTIASIMDGHKFACGIQYIVGAPVVYSFGSHQQQDFEIGILNQRPDSNVFVFEIDPSAIVAEKDRDPRVSYNTIGLGGYTGIPDPKNVTVRTMKEIMTTLNHTFIDILKMDIEGFEFFFLENEAADVLPRVGQFLVEVHAYNEFFLPEKLEPGKNTALTFIHLVEHYGLRIFSQEVNRYFPYCCTELSFIQKSWGKWDKEKENLTAL